MNQEKTQSLIIKQEQIVVAVVFIYVEGLRDF